MLEITVPGREYFNEATNEFVTVKEQTLRLEHSLVSLSKWESKWCKPFLGNEDKTLEESIDYVRCMTVTKNVDPLVYRNLTRKNFEDVNAYIEAPMTATWFRKEQGGHSREIITAEVVYYWMIALNIPFECEKWHLNRLLTLIKVCNEKNKPKKKMNRKDILARNRQLNESRRRAMNSKG